MKRVLFILLVVGATGAFAQGAFQDLDFEAANVSGYSPGAAIPVDGAFPGWQALSGAAPFSVVAYDAVSAGASLIEIQDGRYGYTPIQGNYTAFLQGALTPSGGSLDVSLSQNGVIPSGTESIVLDANQSQGASFVVSAGGQTVTLVPVQTISGYTVYEGNVSAWAGLDTTLSITEMGPANQMYSPSLLELDNISFSPNPVTVTPEPSPFLLTGIGGLVFGIYRRFQARRKI